MLFNDGCRVVVGVFIAALLIQTWLMMGLVVPVSVSGSSMAPTLKGPHRMFECEACRFAFPVGLDQLPTDALAVCPQCRRRSARPANSGDRPGDRLVIDRTAFSWREPQRWEPVVFRFPAAANELCVKRVVGLPGETVSLVDGDVWINGRLVRKSLAEQSALRQLVYRQPGVIELPTAQLPAVGTQAQPHWQWELPTNMTPVTDEASYNQRVSRRLNPMRDLMLTFDARMARRGRITLQSVNNLGAIELSLDVERGRVRITLDGAVLNEQGLSAWELPASGEHAWTFSLFDAQVLFAVDGYELAAVPLNPRRKVDIASDVASGPPTVQRSAGPAEDRRQPSHVPILAIFADRLPGEIRNLAVWRDVYYEVRYGDRPEQLEAAEGGPESACIWRLGPSEYFVLGDNAAISDDSRSWPAGPKVDANLLIGRPLGVR